MKNHYTVRNDGTVLIELRRRNDSMKIETHKCDGCPVKRTDQSDGWYLVTVGGPLIITPWSQAKVEDIAQADLHLCGRTCLLKKVNELLDKL